MSSIADCAHGKYGVAHTRQHGTDSQLIERFLRCGCFRFSEPFSTDADPTSHRVRLWRGGSASKVLLPRLYLPRVHLHRRLEVRKRPWLLVWSRGRRRDSAAGGHRSFCDQCLVCLFPVSYCFSLKDVFNNLPSRAAALVAGAPHCQLRTPYAAGWTSSGPSMRSLLRTLRFRSSARFSAFSSQPPLVQLVLQGDCGQAFALLLGPLSGHQALHQLQFYPRRFP